MDVVGGLVDVCRYGIMRHELLRDCIVVGIRDTELSKQLMSELTLHEAVNGGRQQQVMRADHNNDVNVYTVRCRQGGGDAKDDVTWRFRERASKKF